MSKQQKFTIFLDENYSDETIRFIGSKIINTIVKRSNKGYGIEGRNINGTSKQLKKFTPYSKDYKNKRDFKLAGKSSYKVDLELSGEMLEEMELLEYDTNSITIGYNKGENNDKAEGNQTGSYGHKPNSKNARKFLGITQHELNDILKTVSSENVAIDNLLDGILGELFDEN